MTAEKKKNIPQEKKKNTQKKAKKTNEATGKKPGGITKLVCDESKKLKYLFFIKVNGKKERKNERTKEASHFIITIEISKEQNNNTKLDRKYFICSKRRSILHEHQF